MLLYITKKPANLDIKKILEVMWNAVLSRKWAKSASQENENFLKIYDFWPSILYSSYYHIEDSPIQIIVGSFNSFPVQNIIVL